MGKARNVSLSVGTTVKDTNRRLVGMENPAKICLLTLTSGSHWDIADIPLQETLTIPVRTTAVLYGELVHLLCA